MADNLDVDWDRAGSVVLAAGAGLVAGLYATRKVIDGYLEDAQEATDSASE